MILTFGAKIKLQHTMNNNHELKEEVFELLKFFQEDKKEFEKRGAGIFKANLDFWFLVVGAEKTDSLELIHRAARNRWRLVHPDKCDDARALEAAKLIQTALSEILTSKERDVIDLTLDSETDQESDSDSSSGASSTQPTALDSSFATTAITRNCFDIGQRFSSDAAAKTAMKVFAQQEGFCFVVQKDSSKKKNKGNGYYIFTCSRGGKPRPKKRTSNQTKVKTRNRESLKCGCEFKVVMLQDIEDVFVHISRLEHTNGCTPSPEQRRVGKRKRGTEVPLSVMTSLVDLVRVKATHSQLRAFLAAHRIHCVKQDPQSLRNLKLRVFHALRTQRIHDYTQEELAGVAGPENR
jgi:cold shock CspA family protein